MTSSMSNTRSDPIEISNTTSPTQAFVLSDNRQAAVSETQDLRTSLSHQEGEINWITAIFMGLFHIGAIAALFFYSWPAFIVATVLYFLAINIGIPKTPLIS